MFEDLIQAEIRPRYRAIARAIVDAIAQRRINVGDRLPTQRDLARMLDTAVATVGRAYSELEEQGIIASQVGRGTFVTAAGPKPREVLPAMIDLATYRVPVPPVETLLGETLRALAADRDPRAVLGSAPANGTAHHRAALADWLARFGVVAQPDQVVITNGGQHATMAAISTLTGRDDLIATEELADPKMKAIASYLDRPLCGIAMDGQG